MLLVASGAGLAAATLSFTGAASASDSITTTTGIPGVPTITQIAASGNKQIDVAWEAPAEVDGHPAQHYIVQWRTTVEGYDDYYDQAHRSLQTPGTSATIANLLGPKDLHGQSPQYQVRVRAVNDLGPGAWSAERAVQTISTPSAPINLKLERVGSGQQIQVSWDAPLVTENSPPSQYVIHYQRARHSSWRARRTATVDGTQTVFTTEVLEVGVTWRFRVAAINEAGHGNWTGSKKLKLYALPDTPTDVNAIAGDGRLTVEWKLPADDSSIIGSRLRWRPASSTDSDWAMVEFDDTYKLAHTITDLTSIQAYDLEVAAYNPSGASDWVGGPQTTPLTNTTAPINLEVGKRRYDRLDIRWEWPGDSLPVASFTVKWRHSSETDFPAENQVTVDGSQRSHTFYKVPPARSYIVEVTPASITGRIHDSAVGVGYTNSASTIIFKYFRQEYGEAEPWIGDVIDSRNFRIRANGKPGYWAAFGTRSNGWSLWATASLGFSSGVLNGAAYRSWQPVQTVLHEMMHALTYDWRAAKNPGALGVAWLYMDTQLVGRCNGGEILADTLIYPVQQEQNIRYVSAYYRGCGAVGRVPTAEATEVARNALDGELPQWFYDNYQLDDGSIDMESLWYDLRNPQYDGYRSGPRGYLFREMFGGFCSYKEAWRSLRTDRDSEWITTNPWRDGGCLSHRPLIVDSEAKSGSVIGGPSEVHLSWTKPLWTEEPTVNGYLVQWKAAGENDYDDSQRVIIHNLDPLGLAMIDGLEPSTSYTIRVAAIDTARPGRLISYHGHQRYDEISITTPPLTSLLVPQPKEDVDKDGESALGRSEEQITHQPTILGITPAVGPVIL